MVLFYTQAQTVCNAQFILRRSVSQLGSLLETANGIFKLADLF